MTDEQKDKHQSSPVMHVMRHFRARLLTGVLVVVPLWLTYVALRFVFQQLDSVFHPLITQWFGEPFPGVGFLLLFVFLYLIGVIATNIVGRSLVRFGESILNRIPLAKNIYHASKQLLQTISMTRSMVFQRVVLIEYPRKGLRAIAFVTNSFRDPKQNKKILSVFIPTTPNPTSGVFELVPEDEAVDAEMSVEDGIKMVISGGLLLPPQVKQHQ